MDCNGCTVQLCGRGKSPSAAVLKAPFSPAAKPSGPSAVKIVVGVVIVVGGLVFQSMYSSQVAVLLTCNFLRGGIHILCFLCGSIFGQVLSSTFPT